METRGHFAIYQQVCCRIRAEGLLPTHGACPGMVQLFLMRGRNSFVFPTAHLEPQRLAESWAMRHVVIFRQGHLRVFCFHYGNEEHVFPVGRS